MAVAPRDGSGADPACADGPGQRVGVADAPGPDALEDLVEVGGRRPAGLGLGRRGGCRPGRGARRRRRPGRVGHRARLGPALGDRCGRRLGLGLGLPGHLRRGWHGLGRGRDRGLGLGLGHLDERGFDDVGARQLADLERAHSGVVALLVARFFHARRRRPPGARRSRGSARSSCGSARSGGSSGGGGTSIGTASNGRFDSKRANAVADSSYTCFERAVRGRELVTPGAQLLQLLLERLAPAVEIGEHALAQRPGLPDHLATALARRLDDRTAALVRGLELLVAHPVRLVLRVAHDPQRPFLGLAPHLVGRLLRGTQRASHFLADQLHELLARRHVGMVGAVARLLDLALERFFPRPRLRLLLLHEGRDLAQERAHRRFVDPALLDR